MIFLHVLSLRLTNHILVHFTYSFSLVFCVLHATVIYLCIPMYCQLIG
jgi:hypothetical protein